MATKKKPAKKLTTKKRKPATPATKAAPVTKAIVTVPVPVPAPAPDPTVPTDDDWEAAIHRFKLFDDLENEHLRRQAKALPKVLEREADAIYRLVNQLLRTESLPDDVDLSTHEASAIHERIIRRGFFYGDPFGGWIHETLLCELSESLTKSETLLRDQADILQTTSERVAKIISLYEESVEMIRTAPRGRYPSVSMYWLIRTTDRWGASISQIARQLIKYNAESWSENDDMDPMERWTAILKKGRTRARRRGSNEDD